VLAGNGNLSNIVDDCLQQMARGDSLEVCLARYPQQAEAVAPLLRTAALLQNLPRPSLSPLALETGESRLLAQAVRLRQERRISRQPRPSFLSQLLWGGRRWAVSLAMTLLLIFSAISGGIGIAYAANESLPGDTLYDVKLFGERLALAFAFGTEDRAFLHLTFAERRLEETIELVERGRPLDDAALFTMQQETQAALTEAQKAADAETLLAVVVKETGEQQSALEQVQVSTPADQIKLTRAKEEAGEGHDRAVKALWQAQGKHPATDTPVPTPQPTEQPQPATAPVTPKPQPTPKPHPTPEEPAQSKDNPTPEKGPDKEEPAGQESDKGQSPGKEKADEQKPSQGQGQDKDEEDKGQGQGQGQGQDKGQGQGQGLGLGLGKGKGLDNLGSDDDSGDGGGGKGKAKGKDKDSGKGKAKGKDK
jgi:outer membrane biosynthesis protein TonB